MTEALAGVSLALVSQTSFRISKAIGAGEIGIALFCMISVLLGAKALAFKGTAGKLALGFLLYYLFVMVPLTIIHSEFGTVGSSPRDLLAYGLSVALIVALVVTPVDPIKIARWLIIAFILVVILQFIYGGTGAWYSTRFTGGAANPNQLALYCVCVLAMTPAALGRWRFLAMAVVVAVLYLAFKARSDAFMAYMAATVCFFAVVRLVPKKYFVPLSIPLAAIICLSLLVFFGDIASLVGLEWETADEGGYRLVLYSNGLQAWLSGVDTFLIGNGAGAFSGLTGPFQKAESHNTIIDMLAIGGILGFIVLYSIPLRTIVALYAQGRSLGFALFGGLLVFAMFHFVARQPIWWFTIVFYLSMAFPTSSRKRNS